MISRWKKRFKEHFIEALKIKTTPHEIALGFAIGTFIAILPIFGLHIWLAILIIAVFKQLSKIALFAALFFWNPFFTIPVYTLSLKIGGAIFGSAPVVVFKVTFLNQAYDFSRRLLVGSGMTATILSIVTYVAVFFLVRYYQKKRTSNSG